MLIIFSGRPGTGKTTIARELARRAGALYLRIDSIEQGILRSALGVASVEDAGYRAAYAVAEDNLRLGRAVVADSVNPLPVTRDAWRDVARRAGVNALDVEVVCSDKGEHRRRIETRTPDIDGQRLPTWAETIARRYEPPDGRAVRVDTARSTVDQSVAAIQAAIPPDGSL
jgi:predicted kinase